MYRQVYQHRVLQAADALTYNIAKRFKDLFAAGGQETLRANNVFADQTLSNITTAKNYSKDASLETNLCNE